MTDWLDINCLFCGKVAGSFDLDTDPMDAPARCEDCKTTTLKTPKDHVSYCPWCGRLMLLGQLMVGQRHNGDCTLCDMPVTFSLDEQSSVRVEKLFGGPKSAKTEGEAEWEV